MSEDELIAKLKNNDFDYMWELVTDILIKVSGKLYLSNNFEKMFSPYILCRYISMKPSLIEYAMFLNNINSNSRLSKKQFYELAYELIPKQPNSFIKYIKKKERVKEEKPEEISQTDTKTNLFEL